MQIAQDKVKLYTSKKIMFNAKVHNEKIYWHIHPWNTNVVSIWKLKRLSWPLAKSREIKSARSAEYFPK